jgi:Flp pilus assembly protein TadB
MLLVEGAVALACVGLVLLVAMLISNYWSKYSAKVALDRQFDEQFSPEIGVEQKTKKNNFMLKWDKFWEKRLVDSGINFMAANRSNAGKIVIYFDIAALALLTLIFGGSILGAAIIVVAANIIAAYALGFIANKKLQTLSGQVPEFLSALSAANDASGALQPSLIQAIGTTPNELHEELRPVEESLAAGGQLRTVLTDFYNTTVVDELRFLVACIIMADESGKDIKGQLVIIQDVVNSRMEIARHLSKAIASIMPTVWVATIFIPAMFLYTYLAQPLARTFWFHSFLSWILLFVIIGLYLLGIWVANHQVENIKKL